MKPPAHRPAWVEIDLSAVRQNAAILRAVSTPAALCAVVKADAYGHGAPAVAAAALEGGATWLAVALVEEGVALRDAGIEGPVLLLSEPVPDAMHDALAHGLVPTVYTGPGVAAAAAAAKALGVKAPVQVKLDTGMHRVGASPGELEGVVMAVTEAPSLEFQGLWTHFAIADETGDPFTSTQLGRLEGARTELSMAGLPAPSLVHAANSAGAIAHPASRLDLVRCGLALYGHTPSAGVASALASEIAALAGPAALRPVLSWRSRVTLVRELPAGERPSYGRLAPLGERSVVATVPVGYHDGIPRAYFTGGGEVLIGGRRRRLAGAVTMDQIVVDCGPAGRGPAVRVGDDVVLIGSQGGETIDVAEWASRLGVIGYEVLCGIGPRVPRVVAR